MTSRLRVRNCGGVAPRVRSRTFETLLATDPIAPAAPNRPAADSAAEKFGVIVFEGDPWQVSRVVLAFDTRLEAASYATDNSLADYLIAPLSFLVPGGVPRV